MSKEKVLVLGSDTRSFLTVIRSLGRKGLEVHVAWCARNAAARYSRYVAKVHEIPSYDPMGDNWKTALQKILEEEHYRLVIPCDDQSILPLQLYRRNLEPMSALYLLDDDVFKTTSNKQAMFELASSLGIPVPRGTTLTNKDNLEEVISDFDLPVVLKPFSSFTPDNLNHRHEIRKAFSHEELLNLVQTMTERDPILIQENFSGVGAGVELLANKGKILTIFQHVRVHELLHGGGGPYRRSEELSPELIHAAEKLIKALSYTGVSMVEFKVNPNTKKWVFLEINARFWGSLPLAVASGIDFPWYLYEMLVKGRQEFNQSYRKGLYCRNLVGDIEWFRSNLQADHSNPFLHTVPISTVIWELRNLFTFREHSDTFVTDDLWPGFVDLYMWGKAKATALKRKICLKIMSLNSVKFIERRKTVKMLRKATSILFVCSGNICRSPFASLYSRTVFGPRLSILSSGLSVVAGRNCPANAIRAARQQGIDLTSHSATPLSEKALDEASIVFVFDIVNYEVLVKSFRSAKRKVIYLGTFLSGRSLVIDDPDGSDIAGFCETYRRIASAIMTLKGVLDKDMLAATQLVGERAPLEGTQFCKKHTAYRQDKSHLDAEPAKRNVCNGQ